MFIKDLRFIWYTFTTAPFVLGYAIPKARKVIKNPNSTLEEKHAIAWRIVQYMRRHFKTKTYVFGLENLPEEDGYIAYCNHQGKYDALCLFEAMGRDSSVLWEKNAADRILAREIVQLLDAAEIDLKDPRDIVRAINKSIDIVRSGRNMMIFPEGGYAQNENTLQTFNTGCFSVSLKTKSTMVPVVLYDAYRAMNTNYLGRVETQIHFLKPIPYEEYKDMRKNEIADMLKGKIQAKLDEIQQEKDSFADPKLYSQFLAERASKIMDKRDS